MQLSSEISSMLCRVSYSQVHSFSPLFISCINCARNAANETKRNGMEWNGLHWNGIKCKSIAQVATTRQERKARGGNRCRLRDGDFNCFFTRISITTTTAITTAATTTSNNNNKQPSTASQASLLVCLLFVWLCVLAK